jgi:hypothetical protein
MGGERKDIAVTAGARRTFFVTAATALRVE